MRPTDSRGICAIACIAASALAAIAVAPTVNAATQSKKHAFGAIAYEPERRAVGYAYDLKSARDAKVEALKQCGDPGCVVVLSFSNACGAVARGPGKPFALAGATRAEAETKALRACGNKACEVVAWACTR